MSLVLRRRPNESIVIGEGPNQVKVIVLGWEQGKIRLALEADKSVKIFRQEVYDAIKRKEQDAA